MVLLRSSSVNQLPVIYMDKFQPHWLTESTLINPYQFWHSMLSLIIFFWFNTLKGTAKAPTVDFWRLNMLSLRYQNCFFNYWRVWWTPHPFCMGGHPPQELCVKYLPLFLSEVDNHFLTHNQSECPICWYLWKQTNFFYFINNFWACQSGSLIQQKIDTQHSCLWLQWRNDCS